MTSKHGGVGVGFKKEKKIPHCVSNCASTALLQAIEASKDLICLKYSYICQGIGFGSNLEFRICRFRKRLALEATA